jgi:hypothetical protein
VLGQTALVSGALCVSGASAAREAARRARDKASAMRVPHLRHSEIWTEPLVAEAHDPAGLGTIGGGTIGDTLRSLGDGRHDHLGLALYY